MSSKNDIKINVSHISEYIAKNHNIWQMNFLDTFKFHQFTHDRGSGFAKTHIEQLWKLKLLRADLIKSKEDIYIEGIIPIGKDEWGINTYFDDRKLKPRSDGWVDALADIDNDNLDFSIFFHPFRLYILYYLDKVTNPWAPPKYILIPPKWYKNLMDDIAHQFSKWSSNAAFIEKVKYFDEITTLAILLEPWNYSYISDTLTHPLTFSADQQKKLLEQHVKSAKSFCHNLTEEQIFDVRQQLCTKAELLDPNKNIHTLIRFMSGNNIVKVKGKLGGAMVLLLMAETIRRTYENIYKKELKEEDEMGFGVMPIDLKTRLYGNKRLMDGDKKAEKNFIAQFGLDYSIKIRFYLEGSTEYGAIKTLFDYHHAFEFINLSGEFAQGRRKGLTFVENLKNDINKNVFSIVLVDSDDSDNLRLLKNAAKRDNFFGMRFASMPDFEMNFSINELVDVVCKMVKEDHAELSLLKEEIIQKIGTVNSGKEFFDAIQKLCKCKKSEKWGTRLIEYLYNPDDNRPLFDFIKRTVRLIDSGYHYYRSNHRVDIETGLLILKEKNNIDKNG